MNHRLFAAWVLLVAACPGDASPTSETTGETSADTSAGPSADTSAGSGTTAEAPTTGADETSVGVTSEATSEATTGAPGTSEGTETTATTGALDDTGGSSSGSGAPETTSGETTSGETGEDSSEGGESSTGECSELSMESEATAMALEGVVEGVLYSSESDYPWTVVALACVGPATADNIKTLIEPVYMQHDDIPLVDRVVEERSFVQFFDKLTVPQDWWDDWYYEQAEQYKPIRMVLEESLTELQVFRLGEQSGNELSGQIDVIVIGRSGEDLVAIMTIAVET